MEVSILPSCTILLELYSINIGSRISRFIVITNKPNSLMAKYLINKTVLLAIIVWLLLIGYTFIMFSMLIITYVMARTNTVNDTLLTFGYLIIVLVLSIGFFKSRIWMYTTKKLVE